MRKIRRTKPRDRRGAGSNGTTTATMEWMGGRIPLVRFSGQRMTCSEMNKLKHNEQVLVHAETIARQPASEKGGIFGGLMLLAVQAEIESGSEPEDAASYGRLRVQKDAVHLIDASMKCCKDCMFEMAKWVNLRSDFVKRGVAAGIVGDDPAWVQMALTERVWTPV